MDRLIRLDPSNIVPIRIEPGQKCHGEITLRNVMHTMPVAFCLQPLIKTRYTIKPHSAIIPPLSTLTVEILYHLPHGSTTSILPHSFPFSDDSFLLHSVVVPGAAATKKHHHPPSESAVPNDWFTAKKKQVFIDTAIKIIFIGSPILTQLISHGGAVDEIRHVLEFSDPKWKAVDSKDAMGNTLLHLAISQRRPDLVQLLLEFEPNMEATNNNRYGSTTTPLEAACFSGEALIVEFLLARNANTERSEGSEWGPIHLAAREGHVEVLRLLLKNINALDKDGNTALHLAVEERRRDCVKLLVANGARTDIRNARDGDTVLHVAAVTGEESVIKLLLRKGANKDVRNALGKTAYDVASENGHAARVLDALRFGDGLCVAARKGEVREIRRLLECGAVINGRDQHGWTALHRACFKGRVEAVRILLEKGVDVDGRDHEGYTALHCAVESGNGDVTEVLVKKGADVEARTDKGVTALEIAESLNYVGITRILLGAGASRERIGRTAEVTVRGCFDRSLALAVL